MCERCRCAARSLDPIQNQSNHSVLSTHATSICSNCSPVNLFMLLVVTNTHIQKPPAAGPSSKYCMRVELYKHNNTYTLLVDHTLVLHTSSKHIAERACAHCSTSSEPYQIPISPPLSTTSKQSS